MESLHKDSKPDVRVLTYYIFEWVHILFSCTKHVNSNVDYAKGMKCNEKSIRKKFKNRIK